MLTFICHSGCSTCKKARAFLDNSGAAYEVRDIVIENPTREELANWHEKSGLDIRKLFNTSGMKYRELNLKDKLGSMTLEECLDLLATDGMLVKRPVLVGDSFVFFGFREADWNNAINN